jgi:hypothetical protein
MDGNERRLRGRFEGWNTLEGQIMVHGAKREDITGGIPGVPA